MILLIDWGNTQLKLLKCDSLSKQGVAEAKLITVDGLESLAGLIDERFEAILFSSVRNDRDNQQLSLLLENKSDNIFVAQTGKENCGVTCAYENPASLGIDRWLGILAVEKPSQSIGLISVGTAITLDVIEDKKHLGGHILPGKQLMINSLLSTGQVRPELNGLLGQSYLLGSSTSECVNYGVDACIESYLSCAMQSLHKTNGVKRWVFTGGGGNFWANRLANKAINIAFEPLIVFEGLVKLYLDNQNK